MSIDFKKKKNHNIFIQTALAASTDYLGSFLAKKELHQTMEVCIIEVLTRQCPIPEFFPCSLWLPLLLVPRNCCLFLMCKLVNLFLHCLCCDLGISYNKIPLHIFQFRASERRRLAKYPTDWQKLNFSVWSV